ncbi:hypothetical protein [Homoserinimonas hongtaonis]|uniref:Uncharacterized protein n=1 Tax=Homoserinimonas hongtaonis TaxID=2079791 RepID=A0A2U1SZJ5_9MICO|nr:hypothetical protein [Salinibacterium hongtaonis]PWB97054.1 hypothetical protein DF220_03790 [Salinibacterium hongtaonis]
MTSYLLREFTPERLSDVAGQWEELAGEDEFVVEMATVFAWAESHLVHRDGDAYALELYDPLTDKAGAILEVVDGRRGTLTKLLKLYVSPEFWNMEQQSDRLQLIDMHASAYTEIIRVGMDKGVEDVKIYGRTDMMLEILKVLQSTWPTEFTGTIATMEGRWLRIARGQ